MVLTTTLVQLEMAIEGKVDFVKKTNPWGSKEEKSEEEIMQETVPSPETAAQQIIEMVKTRQMMRNQAPKPSTPRRN